MARFFSIGVALLCFGHNFAWAATEEAYFGLGKSLELKPPGTYTISSVEWRHNDDIAAEWTGPGAAEEYYRNFKGRAVLDKGTGVLKLSNMTEAEAGEYSVEINGKRLDVQFLVKSVGEIQKVDLWVKPKDGQRELDCSTNLTNVGPVTYSWDTFGNGSWFESGRKLVLQNNETTQAVKTFSCKIRNPVGEKESEQVDNPFYKEPPNNAAYAALVLIPIAGGAAFFAYKKRKYLLEKIGLGPKEVTPKNTAETESLQGGDNAAQPSDKS